MIRGLIEHSYWVVPKKLLAGEYPCSLDETESRKKIRALIDGGITAFIDLTHESDRLLPYASFLKPFNGIFYERFPIRDVSVPDSKDTTAAILRAIDSHMGNGRVVYVHCWGGIGRTGVIVGCWLAQNGFEGKAALKRLRELWRHCPKSALQNSPETPEQERYIINWIPTRT